MHGNEARMLQNKQTMYIFDFVCSQNKQTSGQNRTTFGHLEEEVNFFCVTKIRRTFLEVNSKPKFKRKFGQNIAKISCFIVRKLKKVLNHKNTFNLVF